MAVEKWRARIGQYVLQKKLDKIDRVRSAIGLHQARSVGVIYNATDRNSYQSILKFIKFLKEERKQVYSLGFIQSKDPNQMLKDQLNDKYFNTKDLNWLSIPACSNSNEFVGREMDVLINLGIQNEFPLECLTRLANARFKVGHGNAAKETHFDLMIDIEKNKTVDFLIVQLKHYLKLINSKTHVQQV